MKDELRAEDTVDVPVDAVGLLAHHEPVPVEPALAAVPLDEVRPDTVVPEAAAAQQQVDGHPAGCDHHRDVLDLCGAVYDRDFDL